MNNSTIFRRQYAVLGYPVNLPTNPIWADLLRYAARALDMTTRDCELALTQE